MKTTEQIVEVMHKEHCYQGMVKLYHAWFGFVHSYVYYNQEDLYIVEDLEAPLDDFTFKQFLSDYEIIELMEQEPRKAHWIEHEKSISTGFRHLRECSNCNCYFDWLMPRNSFCPNCGSDMR